MENENIKFKTRDLRAAAAISMISGEIPSILRVGGRIYDFCFTQDYTGLEKEYLRGELDGNLLEFSHLQNQLMKKIK